MRRSNAVLLAGLLGASVAVACGGEPPQGASGGAAVSGASGDPAGGTLGGAGEGAKDCSVPNEGCPCQDEATAACFGGTAAQRGQPGCKDGTRVCEARGEFRVWGACTGDVTTCAPATTPTNTTGGSDGGAGTEPEPSGLTPAPGAPAILIAAPNYTTCAALPAAGKRGYGQCDADKVVVIVNDGTAQEMTCCPVGANVLSTAAAERHVLRTGTCQADEVATGMQDPNTPGVYCTKINARYLKLSAPITSRYVNGNVPGVLGQIASSYNVSDTCICDEGTVVIGGHTPRDNRCEEKCVRIEKR